MSRFNIEKGGIFNMKNNKSIYELLRIVDSIEGWLDFSEQFALLHLPALVDHLYGDIVEIGSYKGKSTVALGLGSSLMSTKKRPIYAIDPFIPDNEFYHGNYFDFFWDNIKNHGLEGSVIPIKKYSTEAYGDCPKSIVALFIDGNHEYSSVKHDIIHYAPRVVKGGLIAFHDYGHHDNPGVAQAIHELCMNKDYEYFGLYNSLLVIRKL